MFGWCGRILRVDLTDRRIEWIDTLPYAKRFLGGRGIATQIYWEEVPALINAFDPENRLILMTGPLAGTGAQGASRFEVVARSPMRYSEGFCYGNLGGHFAPALKQAGFDGIVVQGSADAPCYIWIDQERVEIRDGSELWGNGTYRTIEMLKRIHGRDTRIVTTGPAGENCCRAATINTELEGSATGGFGAVMGSKRLKAIAVGGSGRLPAADPDGLKDLNRYIIHLNRGSGPVVPLPEDQVRQIGKAACRQCGMECLRNRFRTADGKTMVRKCQSMAFYIKWAARQGGKVMAVALEAPARCNDISLCTMEMSVMLDWLFKCYQDGVWGEKETGLDFERIGTPAFFEQLTDMIAHRQGFGALLAEGLMRAGDLLGAAARSRFTERISDVGLGSSYSPREYPVNAMVYATEPRQAIGQLHEISYLIFRWLTHRSNPEQSPVSAGVFRDIARRFWLHPDAWDMTTVSGKAPAVIRIQNRTLVKDSLAVCDPAYPIMDTFATEDRVGDPTVESRLFSAVTGWQTDEAALLDYGDRIFNVQRGILLREGWQPLVSDVPPDFVFDLPFERDHINVEMIVPGADESPVSIKGSTLDRGDFENMRSQYYQLRGWDAETGCQTAERLDRLGLTELKSDLAERRLLR